MAVNDLSNLGGMKNEVLVRMGVLTTAAYYTDQMLFDEINIAHKWAAGYKKWPFTFRHDASFAFDGRSDWYAYPTGFKSDSIRYLMVGGKRHTKTHLWDYQIYLEDSPQGKDRIWSGFGRVIYINPNTDVSGTIETWGQYLPANLDPSDPTSTTIFSGYEEDGNEAIIDEVVARFNQRERQNVAIVRGKFSGQAPYHSQLAAETLERIWQGVKDEQFGYLAKNREMFVRVDILRGANRDDIFKRDQFY